MQVMNLPMLFRKLLDDIYTAYIYGFLRVLWKYVSQTTYFHKNMLQFPMKVWQANPSASILHKIIWHIWIFTDLQLINGEGKAVSWWQRRSLDLTIGRGGGSHYQIYFLQFANTWCYYVFIDKVRFIDFRQLH